MFLRTERTLWRRGERNLSDDTRESLENNPTQYDNLKGRIAVIAHERSKKQISDSKAKRETDAAFLTYSRAAVREEDEEGME